MDTSLCVGIKSISPLYLITFLRFNERIAAVRTSQWFSSATLKRSSNVVVLLGAASNVFQNNITFSYIHQPLRIIRIFFFFYLVFFLGFFLIFFFGFFLVFFFIFLLLTLFWFIFGITFLSRVSHSQKKKLKYPC